MSGISIPYATSLGDWPEYAPDEILPGLWQGGTEDNQVLGFPTPAGHYHQSQPFDVVITLYADAMPAPWGVEEVRFGFPDAGLTPRSIERVLALSEYAHRRWSEGARVLIRCQAGVNRSGLVTTLTFMREGYTPQDAIALIRQQRGGAVLCNDAFVHWLATEAPALVSSTGRAAA